MSPTFMLAAASAPVHHVQLGIYSHLPGLTNEQSVERRERQLGRTFAIDAHYYAWSDPFPLAAERADLAHGRVPLENWGGVRLDRITNDSQDGVIEAEARRIKAFGHPIFLRPMPEMNGNWYPWSGHPRAFIAAWRHIWDVFERLGVTNVSWVWSPNADSHPGGTNPTSANSWTRYYPGDAYVDWVGIDGYNWGDRAGNTWRSFGSIFAPVYDTYAGHKPIMIAETSSVEWNPSWGRPRTETTKAAWIAAASRWIRSHPDVWAFVWFDTNRSSTRIDWRISSSSGALDAYRSLASDPYFARAGTVKRSG